MSKILNNLSLTKSTTNYVSLNSAILDLTKSVYVESLIMSIAFNNGYIPTPSEIEDLRLNFSTTTNSNITGDFRDQISTFPINAQYKIIEFLYKLNLVEGYKIKTEKMANLFKNEELCYFALGKIGRGHKLVASYIHSYSLITYTLGISNAPNNEYLLFSNYQQFTLHKNYPLYANLLNNLRLPSHTQVIKVHYNSLSLIYDAIKAI